MGIAPTPHSQRHCTAATAQVDSIDGGSVAADGSGHITVLGTVTESAALWASNGKQADSYHTTYQVEYAVIWTQHGWRIASATVLGK
jgi:hypothetical protein